MLNENKQLKAGAILSYISIAVGILSGLIYTPWMIAQIGQSDYGLYTLATSLITLFLMDFGLSAATARYLSDYHARGEEEKVNSFLGVVYKLYFLIDAVILLALILVWFFLDEIYVNLTPGEMEKFRTVYLIAASFSVINFPFVTLNGILTAYGKFVQLKLADLIHRVITLSLTIFALRMGHGLYALVTVNAIAGLAVILYKLAVVCRATPVKVNFRGKERRLYRDIFGFSLWTTLASLFQRLIFNITPSILGMVSSSAAIAVFGVVTTIEGHFYTLASAINGMFMPRVARIYAGTGPENDVYPLMRAVGRFQFALNGLIVAGFAVIGREFIGLWMGDGFRDAYAGILVVIIPGLFYNSMQIANTAVVVTKHVKYNAYINMLMGLVNVTLSLIWSRTYGVLGSCASIFVAYTVRNTALTLLYHRKMNINMPAFARECWLKMSVPVLLTIAAGAWLAPRIPLAGWTGLVLKATAIALIYVAAMLLFAFDSPAAGLRKLRSVLKRK